MCTAFSQLQYISFAKMSAEEVEVVKEYGRKHLEFCMKLYKAQVNQGLYFLHEHPDGASSWNEVCVREVRMMEGVERVTGDMCTCGMKQKGGC